MAKQLLHSILHESVVWIYVQFILFVGFLIVCAVVVTESIQLVSPRRFPCTGTGQNCIILKIPHKPLNDVFYAGEFL